VPSPPPRVVPLRSPGSSPRFAPLVRLGAAVPLPPRALRFAGTSRGRVWGGKTCVRWLGQDYCVARGLVKVWHLVAVAHWLPMYKES
jgi:hypothetical protein